MNNTGSVNGPDANNYIHATLNVIITGVSEDLRVQRVAGLLSLMQAFSLQQEQIL